MAGIAMNTRKTTSAAAFVLLFFACCLLPLGSSLSFNYSTFNHETKDIIFEGDASLSVGWASPSVGWIDVSANSYLGIGGSSGRVSYAPPVPLWDAATGEVASFTTSFSFNIEIRDRNNKGKGMAFFLASYPSSLPAHSYDWGLGLTNQSTGVASGDSRFVAVEFDTFNDTIVHDPNTTYDHLGIDVNSVVSVQNLTLPSFSLNGSMTATIQYDNMSSMLAVALHLEDWQYEPKDYNLSAKVDLKSSLPEQVAVGFSASTSTSVELHRVKSWSFSSSLQPKAPPTPPSRGLLVGVTTGAASFVLLCATAAVVLCHRKKKKKKGKKEEEEEDMESEDEEHMLEIEMEAGPRRFPYHQLLEATNNFALEEKLGQGGFGAVYRGYLKEHDPVAIKRFLKDSSMQGKKEFKAEIKVISRLRHRNLVQLIGWCHGREELLLVYELVHNRSLDVHLYSHDAFLTWPMRRNIVLGLGSALLYLHEEWEQCVVHGDIKPSNVMLDESFNAKLGDFGLARLIDHGVGGQTMTAVSGTPGYMDPECVIKGRARAESDIYSFGIVLLEVACGRRPMKLLQGQKNDVFRLLEWVWNLYGQKVVLEAADKRLNDNFNEEEMERVMVVGLWCAHPDPSMRPSIKLAMTTLQSKEARLPILPNTMPVPTYASPVALMELHSYTSSSAMMSSATQSLTSGSNIHTTSSSSGCQDSSWLLKDQQ